MSGINGINGPGVVMPPVQTGKENPVQMKRALEDFESLFINQMLKVMRESVGKSDLFHGGSGEEIYTSLFDTELSKLMSKNGGMGLSNMLMKQFSPEETSISVPDEVKRHK